MSNYNRQPVAPVIMVAAGVVLILGAIFWSMSLGQNGAVTDLPQSGGVTPEAAATRAIRVPLPEIARISAAEAKAALDAGEAVFIDTRGEASFASEHIPGAIAMTADEVPARLGELDPNTWIITYCT